MSQLPNLELLAEICNFKNSSREGTTLVTSSPRHLNALGNIRNPRWPVHTGGESRHRVSVRLTSLFKGQGHFPTETDRGFTGHDGDFLEFRQGPPLPPPTSVKGGRGHVFTKLPCVGWGTAQEFGSGPGILEHSFSSPVSLGVAAEKRQCTPRKEEEAAETQVEEESGLCPEMEAEGGEKGPAG